MRTVACYTAASVASPPRSVLSFRRPNRERAAHDGSDSDR